MNLNEFLASPLRNSYIKEWEGSTFYVIYLRKGRRMIDGIVYEKVLDLANIAARKPGKGAFAHLHSRIRDTIKLLGFDGIYVESILNDRFTLYMERLGYIRVNLNYGTVNLWQALGQSHDFAHRA